MISAETTLPRAVPFRVIAPLKWPKRCNSRAAGVPALVDVPTASPCATSRANAGAEIIEQFIAVITLNDRLDLGAVLVVVAQRGQRDLGLPRLAVAQYQ